MPIRRALSTTIRDALDVYHNAAFDTSLQIRKLENIGLNMTETIVSVLLVVGGFLVYYLIPLSFIYSRLDLFFRIMTVILLSRCSCRKTYSHRLGMVIGQILLSQAFQPYFEQVAVYISTFVTTDRNLAHIVQKNLMGHVRRDRAAVTSRL